jgi:hypothetical protein
VKASGFTQPEIDRFWSFVDRAKDGCWLWTGPVRGPGYGGFRVQKRSLYAHRFSLMLKIGILSPKLCALHSCDVRRCVKPEHLRAGTVTENNRDAMERGRRVNPRGDDSPRSVFTSGDVTELRRMHSVGMSWSDVQDFAAHLGVSPAAVYHAATRRTWKHLP